MEHLEGSALLTNDLIFLVTQNRRFLLIILVNVPLITSK